MLRTIFFLAFCLITSGLAWATTPQNVLLICIDDLKPTLGCYGDEIAATPHIDALANRGVRFDRAYCNQAVCSPSRNALMTGLRPETIGVFDLSTNFRKGAPNATTMTQHFIAKGYQAEGLGKIYHVGHGNIDDVKSWSVKSWRAKAPSYVNDESLQNIVKDKQGRKRGPATEIADVDDDAYRDGQVAVETMRRLARLSKSENEPFFLAVGFVKPHLPFVAPKKYWDLYDPSKLPMPDLTTPPEGAVSYAKTSFGELRNYSDMPKSGPIDKVTTRHLIHGYYAATSYADAQVGRVLAKLDSLGLTNNTIVVLWGDHGWHLGDHGFWCKHTNYEQAARIPLIISAPQGLRGITSNAFIESVDVYPTLTSLAGIAKPTQQLDGQDHSVLVTTKEATGRSFARHVYPRGGRLGYALRTERFRLVKWVSKKKREPTEYELYDYKVDPLESKNLAAEKPEIVDRLSNMFRTGS